MDRLKYVDGLRGIFALVVVLYHLNGEFFFPGGYLAVDFFFILSGFVLSHVYLKRMEGLSFLNFAGQRFSRLWPLHIVTLFLYLALFSVSHAIAGHDLSDPALWGNNTPVAFVKNVFLIHDLGFNIPPNWNFPSWSISIEFFVNLVLFFAFVGLMAKAKLKWLLGAIFLVVVGYFLIDILRILTGSGQDHSADLYNRGIYHSHIVRGFFEIFLGLLVYFGAEKLKMKSRESSGLATHIRSGVEIILFAGVFFAICTPGGDSDIVGVLLFAGLLLLLSSHATSVVSSVLSTGPFVFLGTISYALYLTHMPVFEFFRQWPEMFGEWGNSASGLMVSLALSILVLFVLSAILHERVEKPAQAWLRKLFARNNLPKMRR
jgi:peptidoglycan/LPS O-acetylase OafA/YrhL